ncbi:MAG: DUF4982 domain-containing protein [Colwellia sp.]
MSIYFNKKTSCFSVWLAFVLYLVFANHLVFAQQTQLSARQEMLFNQDWSFRKGALKNISQLNQVTDNWQPVTLPHDWAIEGPFDAKVSGEQGKLPWQGEGWYKKSFSLSPQQLSNKRIIFLFDGIMANPKVYINGQKAGSWHYGYNSFWLDVTNLLRSDQENQIAVHVSTKEHYSRWYPGAGIYRKIRMMVVDNVHTPIWGVKITTPEVNTNSAKVAISTEITNKNKTKQTITIKTFITENNSQKVLSIQSKALVLAAGESSKVSQILTLNNHKLWDVAHPNLYQSHNEIIINNKVVDNNINKFGIRTFKWTHDKGFYLNGRRVQVKGVNLHHANGPIGSALFKDALIRKLSIMKEMGVNSIRTSHNSPSPELLNLADEMGFVIINELFDKYGATASVDVPTAEYVNLYAEAEIKNFINRDFNHPSVMMWSIGNEVGDVLSDAKNGGKIVKTMVEYFKKYDTTRPTNMGSHIVSSIKNRVLDAVDTQGWNYGQKYALTRTLYPTTPQIYTESASAFSTRGYYQFPNPEHKNDFNANFQESSYDYTSATWSDIPEVEFMRMTRDSYVAGEYVWTGFDYLGEPTPHTQEARSSYFGIVDLVGIPKDRYYLYRSQWNNKEHTLHILPHWTWPERVDKNVPVMVYTDGDEAELFLNGNSLGKRKKLTAQEVNANNSNIAFGKVAWSSSEDIAQDKNGNVVWENRADKAVDGLINTQWAAGDNKFPHWLALDLETVQQIGYVSIAWEDSADKINYQFEVSNDGKNWQSVGSSKTDVKLSHHSTLKLNVKARYVRVYINHIKDAWSPVTIKELAIKEIFDKNQDTENPYYQIMKRYRLMWNDVIYQPGELKVVAYKKGKKIGEKMVRTAKNAKVISLIPEKLTLKADSNSLNYILVEARDENGELAPHDMSMVYFDIEGPATIIGIGNGNPLSLEPFQDKQHSLFYGKAIVIIRGISGQAGTVTLRAKSKGLTTSTTTMRAIPN